MTENLMNALAVLVLLVSFAALVRYVRHDTFGGASGPTDTASSDTALNLRSSPSLR